jgi:MFS family permease
MYCGGFLVIGLTLSGLGPSIEHLAQHTKSHIDSMSFAFLTVAAGRAGSSVLGGMLSDVYPHLLHRTGMSCALGISIFSVVAPLATTPTALGVVLFCLGVATGGLDVTTNVSYLDVCDDMFLGCLSVVQVFIATGVYVNAWVHP